MAEHKGGSEDEYFAREDAEKLRKLAHEVKKETQAAEQARLKALHWMRCPKCGMQMNEVKMGGVDVDVCFSCNGLFLDRADLSRIRDAQHRGVVEEFLHWFAPETKR